VVRVEIVYQVAAADNQNFIIAQCCEPFSDERIACLNPLPFGIMMLVIKVNSFCTWTKR
jgi:hypothetical protein